jgi:hypothetical protein
MPTGYRASTHAPRPGEVLQRARGITISTTVDAALAAATWPCRVFRVHVDPGDVRAAEGETLRVAACRFEEEVTEREILGDGAEEVRALLDRIPLVPWCQPIVREPAQTWVNDRVQAYVSALEACTGRSEVTFVDIRSLDEVKLLPDILLAVPDEAPKRYRPELFALLADRPLRRNAQRGVGTAAASAMYAAVWDPLWSALDVVVEQEPGKVHPRDAPRVKRALDAARGPAREACRDVVLALASGEGVPAHVLTTTNVSAIAAFTPALGGLSGRDDGFDTKAMTALVSIWSSTWMTAVRMAAAASACVRLLISGYDGPNPWRPLLDLWLAGGVPVSEVEDTVVVYWRCAFE